MSTISPCQAVRSRLWISTLAHCFSMSSMISSPRFSLLSESQALVTLLIRSWILVKSWCTAPPFFGSMVVTWNKLSNSFLFRRS